MPSVPSFQIVLLLVFTMQLEAFSLRFPPLNAACCLEDGIAAAFQMLTES